MNFDKAALAWTLPWDADWVTAVCFIGSHRRVAAGNNRGQILLWDLPDKPTPACPPPCAGSMDTPMSSRACWPRRTAAG